MELARERFFQNSDGMWESIGPSIVEDEHDLNGRLREFQMFRRTIQFDGDRDAAMIGSQIQIIRNSII